MNMSRTFEQILTVFNVNIGTLRVFTQQIGSIADAYDDAYIASMTKNLAEIFDDDVEDVEAVIQLFSDATQFNDLPEKAKKLVQEIQAIDEAATKVAIADWGKQEPEKYRKLSIQFQEIFGQPPAHGKLVRRGSLMILTSFWDALISALVHKYYLSYPVALNSKGRVLTLAELHTLGSIEDAEKSLISDEADFVVRKNFREQMKYFSDRLHLDLSALDEYTDKFQEITQRRNLFVHNSGIVNKVYLSNISKASEMAHTPKLGQVLEVTATYLSESIETVQIVGFVLAQLCWRKWEKNNLDKANQNLSTLSSQALLYQRFSLIESLAKFATELSSISDETAKLTLINYAVALRDIGKHTKMKEVLTQQDWENSAVKFQIAFHTLSENYERVYALLPLAIEKGEISVLAKDWPLFKPIRNEIQFSRCFDT